jgi:hypothetical protein
LGTTFNEYRITINFLISKLFFMMGFKFIKHNWPRFFLIIFFCFNQAYAQGPERLQLPVSPTAASLGKFGQVEMDYFNGLPQLSVPLYTIKSGNISIPISLMYHASGMKPDQKSGWTGLNWSLNMPCAINRILNGDPDEKLLSAQQFDAPGATYPFSASYYNHYAVLDRPDWSSFAQLVDYITKFFGQTAAVRPVPAPDEFVFNFFGFSGSFLLNHKGEWKVKCDKPGALKVDHVDIYPDVPVTTTPSQLNALGWAAEILSLHQPYNNYVSYKKRMIKGFTLIDGEGNKYVFGSGENSIEYSRFPFSWPPEDSWGNLIIPVTYYMTKIIPKNGSDITFEYVKSDYYQFTNTEAWKTMTLGTGGYVSSTSGPGNSVSTSITNGSYLSRINFADGHIEFAKSIMNDLQNLNNSGGGAYMPYDGYRDLYEQNQVAVTLPKYYKLDNIKIYDGNSNLKKWYDLVYEEVSNKRLQLKEVKDVSGATPIKYTFAYYEDPLKPQPPYNSRELDHWGGWNGINWFQTNGNSMTTSNYLGYYNSREPRLDWAIQGSLEKIIYPTGGHTKFIYQLNDYTGLLNYYNGNTSYTFDPAAGITYSENSNPVIKETGGLRIWKIENFIPGVNQTLTKEFDYKLPQQSGQPLKSSGVLAGLPSYREDGQLLFPGGGWWYFLSWQNYNTQPFGLTNGSHVTYSQVKEILPGGAYVVRKYTNSDNPLYRDQKYIDNARMNNNYYRGNMPFSSLALERGLVEEENFYSNSGVLVKTVKYTYNTSATKYDEHIRMVDFTAVDVGTGYNSLVEEFEHSLEPDVIPVRNAYSYKKYIYQTLPTRIEETTRSVDGHHPVTTITGITYNSQQNIKERSVLGSDNKLTKVIYKYAADYPSTGTDNASLAIANLKNKNYNNAIIEKITIKSNADGSGAVVLGAELNFYDVTRPDFRKQLKLSQTNPVAYTPAFESYIGADNLFHYNAGYEASPVYEVDLYNSTGNILQERDRQGIVSSYLWDNENQLAVMCKGAEYNDIASTSFETANTGNWTYTGGSVADITAPTGKLVGSVAVSAGLNKLINSTKTYQLSLWVKGVKPVFTAYLSAAGWDITPQISLARSSNGWDLYQGTLNGIDRIRIDNPGPAISYFDEARLYTTQAVMTSYAYEPLIGIISECDANNRIFHYEYDNLGRLNLIRDQDGNVVKKICYNFDGQPENCSANCINTNPAWQNTSTPLRCQQGSCGNTGYQEQEQRDMNPCSPSYNQVQWNVTGYNPTACVTSNTAPNWQNTATPIRCQQGSCGNNGNQEQEQKDLNPCSPSYNQLRWVVVGYNPTACVPSTTNPNWQNTSTPLRCQVDINGVTTGYQEQQQVDANPCSPTYNDIQWVVAGYNPTACPSCVTITSANNAMLTGFTAVYTNTATGQTYSFPIPKKNATLGCIPAGNYTLTISKPGSSVFLLFGSGCSSVGGSSATFNNVNLASCHHITIDLGD